ncbi:hypothetical protein CoNPh2_CDS0073 [Staphylococcus phage S-CoN_Ph2]|nr:hypothetical protein CoNPh1_CDS0086 [Staphylococcus phage S-CoN_Ph1]WNM51627.1 hypothetical protein CoNPh2_CDS0073 [Staphylococcus phage S-CoN_Ph2]WNM51789.1 hypothetical protein CoNPh3_CDS0075 [Staphylococcus phage S-CoN_Ph3]WNM52288.1 hypothetical protein CoNPh6_CDS0078 [Staphylococcus phage S-CoN_Ph6]WNM52650.1 hypothetical protein CoNPh8_CDS0096 [Staphylococcus phage S-CoN_Ph8]WNM52818.1 hypothetical protein CoNPh9_CDS0089 [Staphylococcus phage S-CoN_Ph9]WNM53364.1 hypothetical protein
MVCLASLLLSFLDTENVQRLDDWLVVGFK